MAASIETGGAARGRFSAKSDVNVTPFVDVMLVLLIVFMVAAPIATTALPVDLSNSTPPRQQVLPPIFVSLQENGVINVGTQDTGEVASDWSRFLSVVEQKTGGDRNRQILIWADQNVPYASVMRLMELLHQRDYRNKMLVTEEVVD
jgi:biopolymer transport protein ExbD